MSQLFEHLHRQFPHLEFKQDELLAPYTTVKIGGPAEVFVETKNSQDFVSIVSYCRKNDIELTILGWGANSLISDVGLKGLVLKNSSQNITIHDHEVSEKIVNTNINLKHRWQADNTHHNVKYEFGDLNYEESDEQRVKVTIDSGVPLSYAMNYLLTQGLTGLQWYSRIPATIGGAIYNNIHGGTHFISEIVESVDVINLNGESKTIPTSELDFDYDFSRFHKSGEIIISVTFLLFKGDVERARTVVVEWAKRKSIQPQNSLGCVFQNISDGDQKKNNLPTNSVGYIVEHRLGLKGFQIGDAKVSEKHCAFIENVGQAKANDYLSLIKKIIAETKQKLNITLKTEIFFLGFTDEELQEIIL